jgi:hypothetical protein
MRPSGLTRPGTGASERSRPGREEGAGNHWRELGTAEPMAGLMEHQHGCGVSTVCADLEARQRGH